MRSEKTPDAYTDAISRSTHLVKAKCLGVRLESLLVILLAFLDEPEDVPAYVGGEVIADTLLDQLKTLVAAPHVCQDETLHAERF